MSGQRLGAWGFIRSCWHEIDFLAGLTVDLGHVDAVTAEPSVARRRVTECPKNHLG
jgi:hypothetical protein